MTLTPFTSWWQRAGGRDRRVVQALNEAVESALGGDFGVRVQHAPAKPDLRMLQLRLNQLLSGNQRFLEELQRLRRVIGRDGRMTERAGADGDGGCWESGREAINDLVDDLVRPTSEVARVITAVAQGDLSQKITVDAKGEILELKNTINTMVDQLSSFADEVTRVAGEVGTEGKLGGQARVKGVSGIWEDLTDNVNQLAANLTNQVRNIAEVTTAVAQGDLSHKITVDAKGEILELKNTINTMVDQLSSFADEVTRVAGEVGTEGKLGGQARVKGVSGIWEDLTDNVNQLAANLTTQVRAIAEVSTAVTHGDLTRLIRVDAQGEVAELKDNVNQMIANLRETTRVNAEQDWLKTNMARVTTLLQGQRDLTTVAQLILSELTPLVSAQFGSFFLAGPTEHARFGPEPRTVLRLAATYGHKAADNGSTLVEFGAGLTGQAAVEKSPILVRDVPADYVRVTSGLGAGSPANLIVLPVLFEDEVLGVIELAALQPFTDVAKELLRQMVETIGIVLNTIRADMRTHELLDESRRLTSELQNQSGDLQRQQEALRQANEELTEKAALLAEQKRSVELTNREIEEARRKLQEKAEQLAISSRYKSEFLANMSHELRTPLNSMLLMAELLTDDSESALSAEQLHFANTIRSSGHDLLGLIDDILDLSKIEAGRVEVEPAEVPVARLLDVARRSFAPIADKEGLNFEVAVADGTPEVIFTDERRLKQILKNLLSNAMKFTHQGKVSLRAMPAHANADTDADRSPTNSITFEVADSGIGIPADKLQHIFEAFQQGDGSTSRRFGGTGLGLSISAELARLLSGEIRATSRVGAGSTFTLVLPVRSSVTTQARPPAARAPEGQAEKTSPDGRPLPPREPQNGLRGRKVILVDDDRRNAFALGQLLTRHGIEVILAEHGRAALSLLDAHQDADVVLMDIMMPELDGLEATRQIRKDDRFADLPIIMLTAKAMPEDREQSLDAGATDFVTKPVDIGDLLTILRTCLDEPPRSTE